MISVAIHTFKGKIHNKTNWLLLLEEKKQKTWTWHQMTLHLISCLEEFARITVILQKVINLFLHAD